MQFIVQPGHPLRGTVHLPGDKSLSHRAVLLSALAEGESRIQRFLVSGVTQVMLDAINDLGVRWSLDGETLTVQGQGLAGLRAPERILWCGNSATTLRMLAGLIAAAGIPAVLDGSAGLRRRPMERIVAPLRRMGVDVQASDSGGAPLVFVGRPAGQRLSALTEDLPVASAQVKSCLLLAALAADGETTLREPGPSRDHTERTLSSQGVTIQSRTINAAGGMVYETRMMAHPDALKPIQMTLPGDISAAAFLIVAGCITPGSEIWLKEVGLNPTRTGLLDALEAMGADVRITDTHVQAGEPFGDLRVRAAALHGINVRGDLVVRMIDEFSAFGTAAAFAEGETCVEDAKELRYKESDRILTLVQELRRLGVSAEERADGFCIQGGPVVGGTTEAHDDHRLAMAMGVAGLAAQGAVTIRGAQMVRESFPEFADTLRDLGAAIEEQEDPP